MPKAKAYTISSQLFKTKEGAKKQLLKYANSGCYREGSMVMEVTAVYDVDIVKVAKLKRNKKWVK